MTKKKPIAERHAEALERITKLEDGLARIAMGSAGRETDGLRANEVQVCGRFSFTKTDWELARDLLKAE